MRIVSKFLFLVERLIESDASCFEESLQEVAPGVAVARIRIVVPLYLVVFPLFLFLLLLGV